MLEKTVMTTNVAIQSAEPASSPSEFEARYAPLSYPTEGRRASVLPWSTHTGTKLETADTAKEDLQHAGFSSTRRDGQLSPSSSRYS
jgi:hypothetical protein